MSLDLSCTLLWFQRFQSRDSSHSQAFQIVYLWSKETEREGERKRQRGREWVGNKERGSKCCGASYLWIGVLLIVSGRREANRNLKIKELVTGSDCETMLYVYISYAMVGDKTDSKPINSFINLHIQGHMYMYSAQQSHSALIKYPIPLFRIYKCLTNTVFWLATLIPLPAPM